VTVFVSIAALLISITVPIITWLQWQVADNKLRLDLFDRRYKVYDATQKFVAVIIRMGRMGVSQQLLTGH
jgi:hypothetical protein